MALVAYDSSDCSDNEDDRDIPKSSSNVETESKFSHENIREKAEVAQNIPQESVSLGRSSLFSSLPPPRSRSAQTFIPETDSDTVLVPNKKEGKWGEMKEVKPVKIFIPSLSELAEDESPNKKPRISKGKGLFSVLPPPKHTSVKVSNRPLIPYSVKPKGAPPKTLSKKSPSKEQCKKSSTENSKTVITANDSDDDDDDELHETLDFFSLESVGKIPDADGGAEESLVPIANDANPVESAYEPVLPAVPENYNQEVCSTPGFVSEVSNIEASSLAGSSSSDLSSMMSDEGFLRLGGTKKRGRQDIQFIDVAQDDQLPSTEEWMRKALMEETGYRPSRKKGFMPTAQQRRKHQITYLAFQAKEREMELQEQWSQNRFTRHQTQSKYGF